MEILCECGHKITSHEYIDGCLAWVNNRGEDVHCGCDLSSEIIEARYWARIMTARYFARVMWCKELAKERDRLKALLYDEGVELRKTRNHYIQACVQRDEIKHKLYKLEDSLSEKDDEDIDEIREQLRMCQLALRTMERTEVELESYTAIAIKALKKVQPNNPGHVNFDIAQDALDKIKGKF
jgi:arginine deiminase